MGLTIIVIVLVLIIIVLMLYNISINKKIEVFSNVNQKVIGLNVLQDFMDTISKGISVDEKLKQINDILIEKYHVKYSTIVVYDGVEYVIKATNVEEEYWNSLKTLHLEECFKTNIQNATPKYITVTKEGERLPYLKDEIARVKSAMFFPLYINNVYIGYWIIEGEKIDEFYDIDQTLLEVVKNNIVSVVKSISNQKVIETMDRLDKFTGLHSEEYLYAEGRNKIDSYIMSAVCMLKITNIEEINRKYGRYTGNEVIKKVSEVTQKYIKDDYVFVRYMGPKFAIVFSGDDMDQAIEKMKKIKKEIESQNIQEVKMDGREVTEERYATPKINVVLTTYYKGTALEGLAKNLEVYLDTSNPKESNVNYI